MEPADPAGPAFKRGADSAWGCVGAVAKRLPSVATARDRR